MMSQIGSVELSHIRSLRSGVLAQVFQVSSSHIIEWEAPHLMRQVKGSYAEGPEAAEHGEDTEAQVISGRDQQESVLTL